MRATLNDMEQLVNSKLPFRGSSVYAEMRGNLYVVYSYGPHFPMYAYDFSEHIWVANCDKYSSTTSRHQSKCNPAVIHRKADTEKIKDIIASGGIAQYERELVKEILKS